MKTIKTYFRRGGLQNSFSTGKPKRVRKSTSSLFSCSTVTHRARGARRGWASLACLVRLAFINQAKLSWAFVPHFRRQCVDFDLLGCVYECAGWHGRPALLVKCVGDGCKESQVAGMSTLCRPVWTHGRTGKTVGMMAQRSCWHDISDKPGHAGLAGAARLDNMVKLAGILPG